MTARTARVPLIGVTPDMEWQPNGVPPRGFYVLDSTNFIALRAAGAVSVMLTHDVEDVPQQLERVDGVLVSGGGYQFPHPDLEDPAGGPVGPEVAVKQRRLAYERALIQSALARSVPLLAVCGGFQVLNAVLGGKLIVSLGASRPGPIEHRQTESYAVGTHTIRAEPGTEFERWIGGNEARVNSKHRQGVVDVGRGARVAARAPDGVVEAIEVPGAPFALGVQWHPEFHVGSADAVVFERFVAAARVRAQSR